LFSRRSQASLAEAEAAAEESLRSIQSEAEDVLRVLAEEEKDAGEEAAAEPEETEEGDEGDEAGKAAARPRPAQDDAELLDEDSSDPEIQLDLARAYISMGDKEAARVILEEVVNNGNEEQQTEARKMLEVLATQ
jgi:pilus assembly protein FimV